MTRVEKVLYCSVTLKYDIELKLNISTTTCTVENIVEDKSPLTQSWAGLEVFPVEVILQTLLQVICLLCFLILIT